MDFRFTPEQEQFRESVRRFAENILRRARARARTRLNTLGTSPSSWRHKGCSGSRSPKSTAGQGGQLIDAVMAIETVASVCPRSRRCRPGGQLRPIRVLAEYGTKLQKERYLMRLLSGESLISVGMTEPEAGSAVTDLQTTATPDGAGYRVTAPRSSPTHSTHGRSDARLRALRSGRERDRLGADRPQGAGRALRQASKFMSDEEWAQIYFEKTSSFPPTASCSRRAGSRSRSRGSTSSGSATRRARSRSAVTPTNVRGSGRCSASSSGACCCEFQGLQWKFAEMKVKLDAGQLLLYRAAANADRGFPSAEETAIAKAFCNQAGYEIANEALQVMGGLGYTQEELVEYCVRRCRGWMIAGGSIEILKNRIAESVFEAELPAAPGSSSLAGTRWEQVKLWWRQAVGQARIACPIHPALSCVSTSKGRPNYRLRRKLKMSCVSAPPRASKIWITRLASDGPNWRFRNSCEL